VSHLIKRIHTDKMPSITKIASIVAAVASVASALPAQPRFTEMQDKIFNVMKRQSAAEQALGLTDVDVLQLYVYTSRLFHNRSLTRNQQRPYPRVARDLLLPTGFRHVPQ
jgi:hypothetical protein